MTDTMNITAGWIAQHTPKGAGAGGRDAAILDVAQDLLLRELHERKALRSLVFKGGTALRKLYAGGQGRFSVDLDFSLAYVDANTDEILLDLVDHIDGITIGPFEYGADERRGKWSLMVKSPFAIDASPLQSKIDISPPTWMAPTDRGWVPLKIHSVYGPPDLPKLQVIRLEENIAEKISRLNRTTTARDMYDLAWIAEHQTDLGGIDQDLVRRLAVLKIWVDAHGVAAASTQWKPGHEPRPFDPELWLRRRRAEEFELQDIGALAVPTPTPEQMTKVVLNHYAYLARMNGDEERVAAVEAKDRSTVLHLLEDLPDGRLSGIGIR